MRIDKVKAIGLGLLVLVCVLAFILMRASKQTPVVRKVYSRSQVQMVSKASAHPDCYRFHLDIILSDRNDFTDSDLRGVAKSCEEDIQMEALSKDIRKAFSYQ